MAGAGIAADAGAGGASGRATTPASSGRCSGGESGMGASARHGNADEVNAAGVDAGTGWPGGVPGRIRKARPVPSVANAIAAGSVRHQAVGGGAVVAVHSGGKA